MNVSVRVLRPARRRPVLVRARGAVASWRIIVVPRERLARVVLSCAGRGDHATNCWELLFLRLSCLRHFFPAALQPLRRFDLLHRARARGWARLR